MTFTIFFDLETGGVQPQHPTIQIGAIAVDASGAEASSFECKILFDESKCDPEALAINGYTKEAWKHAQTERATAASFANWLKPYASIEMVSKNSGKPYRVAKLAGYNAVSFDLPRPKALFGTEFFPCSYLVRDVLQRALFYFDERPSVTPPENFRLATVAAYFDIPTNGAHDALADARMSARLAARLAEEVW